MERAVIFAVVAISLLAVGIVAASVVNYASLNRTKEQGPFLVGVTYCGNSTAEAKVMVDRVKNYTNLFVLQSGPLMTDEASVREIGDYAVSCGLRFAAMFDPSASARRATWLGFAEQRWGDMFAGVYYDDEPGGKMLDAHQVTLYEGTSERITKYNHGSVSVYKKGLSITYMPNGDIFVNQQNIPSSNLTSQPTELPKRNSNATAYYSNGTITFRELGGDFFTMDNGTSLISQLKPRDEWLNAYPFPNCDAVAEKYVKSIQRTLEELNTQWSLHQSFPIFTSDYALYWWDYQGGYDLILAQLGWNNSVAQEIGLVRGAANLQGKPWGTIITWTYTKPPYLTSGNEMYEQMRMSYESGAEYVIIFNYAKDMEGPYGTLKEEHFEALELFWNDVVQNPAITHGGIKAEAAFVLPKNYGWGMRNPQDTVWGLWEPTAEAQQAWQPLQDAVAKYGLRLDIVFDDQAHPFDGKYSKVYYWNQTS